MFPSPIKKDLTKRCCRTKFPLRSNFAAERGVRPQEKLPAQGSKIMPSRKVFSNGWHYWLAKHKEHGLLLYDRVDQVDVSQGCARVYSLSKSAVLEIARESLQSASAEVSDQDFVKILNSYNGFKEAHGLKVIADGHHTPDQTEVKHAQHLERMGLKNHGVRKSEKPKFHRTAHCWACKELLDNNQDLECSGCGWIICECGACGCGRQR